MKKEQKEKLLIIKTFVCHMSLEHSFSLNISKLSHFAKHRYGQ